MQFYIHRITDILSIYRPSYTLVNLMNLKLLYVETKGSTTYRVWDVFSVDMWEWILSVKNSLDMSNLNHSIVYFPHFFTC